MGKTQKTMTKSRESPKNRPGDVNSDLPASSKKQKVAGFLEIYMVHCGKTNACLAIMNSDAHCIYVTA